VTRSVPVNLGQGLKACSFSLESMKLKLSIFAGTTPEDLAEFTQGLAKHTGLKDLSLPCFEFDRNHNVVNSLKELLYLQSLNLNYEDNTICDLGLESLSQSLSKLTSLQNLSLNFKMNLYITDKGLEGLLFALQNLTDLKKLELDFLECRLITDEGMKGFGSALKNLHLLKDIALDFGYCGNITDKGMKQVALALKNLASLEEIRLDFYGLKGITDRGMEKLCHSLKYLNSLQQIDFNFNRTNMTNYGVYSIVRVLKRNVFLKSIELKFDYCPEIMEARLKGKRLNQAFSNLRYLKYHQVSCLLQ